MDLLESDPTLRQRFGGTLALVLPAPPCCCRLVDDVVLAVGSLVKLGNREKAIGRFLGIVLRSSVMQCGLRFFGGSGRLRGCAARCEAAKLRSAEGFHRDLRFALGCLIPKSHGPAAEVRLFALASACWLYGRSDVLAEMITCRFGVGPAFHEKTV